MVIAAIQNVRDVRAAYPGLADIAVLVHEQEPVGQVLAAHVVPSSPGLKLEELYEYARKELPGSTVPAAVMVVGALPTSAGIAEPQAFPAPDLRGLKPYRSPETELDQRLGELSGIGS